MFPAAPRRVTTTPVGYTRDVVAGAVAPTVARRFRRLLAAAAADVPVVRGGDHIIQEVAYSAGLRECFDIALA